MVVRKNKKSKKFRGSKTHGWGAMKKHRGKGNKGGAGLAGTGKRGDAKKPCVWKKKYLQGNKFKVHNAKPAIKTVNIIDIERKFDKLVESGIIKKQGENFEIDLKDLGFNKLLSKGSLTHKIKINVDFASARTIEKVKQAGSEIILKEVKQEKPAKTAEKTRKESAE